MTHTRLPLAHGRRLLLALLALLLLAGAHLTAVTAPAPALATSASGLLAPAAERQNAPRRQATAIAPAPLRTVGGASPTLTGDTEQELRSQSGSLLAASDSAWTDLTRSERAILLDGWVSWLPFETAVTTDPARWEPLWPVVLAADDLVGDAVALDTIAINEVVLALPLAKLGPALADGESQAIAIGPDVVLLVDDVVVGRVAGGAELVPGLDRGEIDDRGLIVPVTSAASADRPGPTATASVAPPRKRSAAGELIPQITLDELPPEAIDTLILIIEGGPFPFERDGATFGNYEERLPAAEHGSYREYTVITPGEDDRGARRIVTGNDDTEFYYTDDHYETFSEIVAATE